MARKQNLIIQNLMAVKERSQITRHWNISFLQPTSVDELFLKIIIFFFELIKQRDLIITSTVKFIQL